MRRAVKALEKAMEEVKEEVGVDIYRQISDKYRVEKYQQRLQIMESAYVTQQRSPAAKDGSKLEEEEKHATVKKATAKHKKRDKMEPKNQEGRGKKFTKKVDSKKTKEVAITTTQSTQGQVRCDDVQIRCSPNPKVEESQDFFMPPTTPFSFFSHGNDLSAVRAKGNGKKDTEATEIVGCRCFGMCKCGMGENILYDEEILAQHDRWTMEGYCGGICGKETEERGECHLKKLPQKYVNETISMILGDQQVSIVDAITENFSRLNILDSSTTASAHHYDRYDHKTVGPPVYTYFCN